MLVLVDNWEFEVDMTATMAYSAQEAASHCDCAYCRNFYAAVDVAYPQLRPLLARFGLDIEAPDELMPFTATNVLCLYAVCGRITKIGTASLMIDGVRIDPEERSISMINTDCPEPLFVLSIGPFDLPWVLEEPLVEEDIVSPANEPGFLRKMWKRIMKRMLGTLKS